jgi:hypothetical protein
MDLWLRIGGFHRKLLQVFFLVSPFPLLVVFSHLFSSMNM